LRLGFAASPPASAGTKPFVIRHRIGCLGGSAWHFDPIHFAARRHRRRVHPPSSAAPGMRALVFEQWQGGHYFNYLECLVPRLASICDEVVVAITAPAASLAAFRRAARPSGGAAERAVRPRRADPGRADARSLSGPARPQRGRCDRSASPDCVFLPSADEQVLALPLHALAGQGGRVRRLHLEAVLHYKGYTAQDGVAERLLSTLQGQLLKTGVFDCLNFVNFLQYEDAVERRLPWAAMARAAGDPVPQPPRLGRAAARQALGLDPGGRYIGMIGDLDARKAVPATLAAFRAAGLAADDRLLLAGRLAEGYAQVPSRRLPGSRARRPGRRDGSFSDRQ
jgi:hypothetical protein